MMFGSRTVELPEPPPPLFSTTYAERRGSLDLTEHGPVLGAPSGAPPEEREAARAAVEAWWYSDKLVLVLPWPVEVTDHRRPKIGASDDSHR